MTIAIAPSRRPYSPDRRQDAGSPEHIAAVTKGITRLGIVLRHDPEMIRRAIMTETAFERWPAYEVEMGLDVVRRSRGQHEGEVQSVLVMDAIIPRQLMSAVQYGGDLRAVIRKALADHFEVSARRINISPELFGGGRN